MAVYEYKHLTGLRKMRASNMWEILFEEITQHEQDGWELVEFIGDGSATAIVRKAKI